ncbi:hypothetical protein Tco_0541906, partial [Tanacetum coccineum]
MKLHNFVQPLLRGRKLGFGSFCRELMPESMSLSSATSDETAGVEELVLILATTAFD